ncbi:hypothetical protein [Marinifilum sp. D714]|uniref:hypothetical protein n=1 Tax=Marinifilum sp. D714 TaxID=2937523 RepID=UPI0027C43F01|nr:hypothetical protein [Marinifilum sp. D714]MDQ2179809.1 hypothetical protein [Marinifilum sp. D714]
MKKTDPSLYSSVQDDQVFLQLAQTCSHPELAVIPRNRGISQFKLQSPKFKFQNTKPKAQETRSKEKGESCSHPEPVEGSLNLNSKTQSPNPKVKGRRFKKDSKHLDADVDDGYDIH